SALNTSEKLDRQQSIYVCFGPIIPVGFARERLGACLNIAPYKQSGRARLSQALLARNKRRSERSSRCAARAALGLPGDTPVMACTLSPQHFLQAGTTPPLTDLAKIGNSRYQLHFAFDNHYHY
ncbi:hypothetical protein, partial [Pseudomonas juntendi]